MDALDGNAVAGALYDVFGAEMTAAATVCATCAASRPLAELSVYLQAPGTVLRCRSCAAVVMVLVEIRGVTCVDIRGLERLDRPE
jgi:hypothetical protein